MTFRCYWQCDQCEERFPVGGRDPEDQIPDGWFMVYQYPSLDELSFCCVGCLSNWTLDLEAVSKKKKRKN